jgi:hypothetical protein
MIPRTGSQKRSPDGKPWGSRYERYLCANHTADPATCPQMPVKRAVIDDAILSYLLQVGLDFQATKLQYDEIANQRVTQAKQLLAQAEREVMRIEVAQQRVESDYLAGELSAGNWERLQDRLSGELGAAGALRDRLAAQTTPRPSDRLQDAESAVLNRFAELRRAVAGEIGSAEDVQALRAILVRLFERFTFHAGRRSQINDELLEGGNHLNTTIGFLRPVPRPDMIEVGLHQYGWSPHPQPLEPPLNNDAIGLPSASKSWMPLESLFGEIPVVESVACVALERFQANIKLVPNFRARCVCWIWVGERVKGGYGRFRPEPSGRKVLAHRWSYEHWIGPIPAGLELDHFRCDNPSCCRPTHVRPVTALQNTRRARHHNANKTHCKHGHRFTLIEHLLAYCVKRGKAYRYRRCRVCLGMDAASITLATLTTRRSSWQDVPTAPRRRVIRLYGFSEAAAEAGTPTTGT